MAVFYGYSSTNSNYIGRLEMWESATDEVANTSTISWTFKVYRGDNYNSSYDRNTGNNFTLTVDGSQRYSSNSFRAWMGANGMYESTANTWCSGSFTIDHEDDGSKSFTATAKYWSTTSDSIGTSSKPLTVSGTFTCTSFARAATITATNTEMGGHSVITINKETEAFYYRLRYSFNGLTGVIAEKQWGAIIWFYPEIADFAPYCTDAKSKPCTIYCETHSSDGTLIGTTSTTITVTVPSSLAPNLSVASALVDGFNGYYLQNKSKVRLTFTASGQYGATISKRTVNNTSVSSPWTSGVLTSSGTVTYSCAVTDSRGYSKSVSVSITVQAYSNPSLSGVSVFRATSSGSASDTGTYISAKATANYASVGGSNSATLKYQYRVKGGSWSSATTMTSGTAVVFGGGNISNTSSYEVLLTVTDSVGNSAQTTITVPTSTVMLDFRPNMDGMGIGAYAESANTLSINPNWNVTAGMLNVKSSTIYDSGVNATTYSFTLPTFDASRFEAWLVITRYGLYLLTYGGTNIGLICEPISVASTQIGNPTVTPSYSAGSNVVTLTFGRTMYGGIKVIG